MSTVWDILTSIQDHLLERLPETGNEVQEPGMDRFNQPGWINRVWTGDLYRRAHLDVVDARNTKGLWMMHCCIFPHIHNSGPIFGLDVIAGKNKITGFFHDYSPVGVEDHPMSSYFEDMSKLLLWNKNRELPDWAKEIFSNYMVAAGNVTEVEELKQVLETSLVSIDYYLGNIESYNHKTEDVTAAHNRYAYYQKQNPHTPRVMTSLGLNEEDVNAFVNECLFPEL